MNISKTVIRIRKFFEPKKTYVHLLKGTRKLLLYFHFADNFLKILLPAWVLIIGNFYFFINLSDVKLIKDFSKKDIFKY